MAPAPVTAAVVSWNTSELLRRCLISFEEPVAAGLVDLWVVDNDSGDGSAEMVRRHFPQVTLIASEENLGYGRAVNAVAERTHAPWIAAANADLELAPGALAGLLRAAVAQPQAGAVAPGLLRGGAIERSVHRFPTLAHTAWAWAGLGGELDLNRAANVDWAHGAFLLIRRSAFEQIGGFDSRQWLFAEDIDLCWRLAQAGWATRYVPSACVLHAGSAATSQAFVDRPAREVAALYGWMARRRGWRVTRSFALLNIAAIVLRLPAFALLALTGGERRRARSAAARAQLRHHITGLRRREAILGYR